MNVFILNTGRCGSTTITRACSHMTNFSAAHESRSGLLGEDHFAYPPNHIEADNRLSWFLGRLEEAYGDEAFYVHLTRDPAKVARSYTDRYNSSIIRAYRKTMLMGLDKEADPQEVALDYVATVTANIRHFLRDKTRQMDFALENAQEDFPKLWEAIGAEGALERGVAEFTVRHNASKGKRTFWTKIFGE